MAVNYTEIFGDLGCIVRKYGLYGNAISNFEAESVKDIAQFDDDGDDAEILKNILSTTSGAITNFKSKRSGEISIARKYITNYLPEKIDSSRSTVADILEDLVAAMNDDSETVLECTVSEESFTGDRTGNGTLTPTPEQLARDADFRVECTDATTEGAETWRVYRRVDGGKSECLDNATTGVAYDDGGVSFTIQAGEASIASDGGSQLDNVIVTGAEVNVNTDASGILYAKVLGTGVTAITITNDGSSQLSNVTANGAIKGTNTDSDGKVYLDLDGTATAITESGDGASQLSGWTFDGVERGENVDSTDSLYITLAGKAASITEGNDESNQLSDYASLTGIDSDNVDDDGKQYFKIINIYGSTYQVEIYSDSGLTNRIAYSEPYTGTGTVDITEDNDSSMGGSLTIDAVTGEDSDIEVTYPMVQISIYKDASRDNLVAQSAWTLGASITDLAFTEQNSSGLSGTVDVAYTADDADIAVVLPFVRVRAYQEVGKATLLADSEWVYGISLSDFSVTEYDDSGLSLTLDVAYTADDADIYLTLPFVRLEIYMDTGLSSLVASSGNSSAWTYDADAAIASATLYEENSSGLSGSFDLDFSTDDTDIEITPGIPFVAGDFFAFSTTTDDAGLFLSFFRDAFEVELPSDESGSNTISENLAS